MNDSTSIARALRDWYAARCYDRHLPWRAHGEPLDRATLVEGLLDQTRAVHVADHYDDLFAGVDTDADWLLLTEGERYDRLACLGLPDLKVVSVDSLAFALEDGEVVHTAALEMHPGVSPYTAAMVALLHGGEGVPLDTAIERVGLRMDGDAPRWMADLMAVAGDLPSATGRPPRYDVACAVLDVGASCCSVGMADCPVCPIRPWCDGAKQLGARVKPCEREAPRMMVYNVTSIEPLVINLDCEDEQVRRATVEVGMEGYDMPRDRLLQRLQAVFPSDTTRYMDIKGQGRQTVARAALLDITGRSWCRVEVDRVTVTEWSATQTT